MADNRKRAPRGGKQAASGSRPIRRNDRAAAPKGQRDRTQVARPQRDRNRDAVQAPKGEFIEGRRAAAEALRTGFPIKCALIAEGGERDAALSRLVDDLNAAGVRIKYVPRAQLDALSSHGAHQGIALEVGNFPYADVADILDRAGDGPALVMGSEGDGISRLVLEKCDFLTKLPQRGMTESLNVAQATTALCFEWLRRNVGELMGEE